MSGPSNAYRFLGESILPSVPSREKCAAARQHAFDDHFVSGEWVNDLNEIDAKELLKLLWSERIEHYRAPEVRLAIMAERFDIWANHHCTAFAEKHEEDYLEGKPCQSI